MDFNKQLIFVCMVIASACCQNITMPPPEDQDPDNGQVPSFEWLEDSGNNEVAMKIVFPDGSEDLAILEHYNPIPVQANETEDVDNCLFMGELQEEESVSVSVAGCPGNYTFTIVFASSKLVNRIFNVEDGVVTAESHPYIDNNSVDVGEAVSDMVERDFDTSMGFDTRSLDARKLPSSMQLNMYLLYDNDWVIKFGENSVNKLRTIINLAQTVFYWDTLTTRIKLNVVGIEKIDRYLESSTSLDFARAHARSVSTNAHVYMFLSVYRGSGPLGIASVIGGVCSADKSRRAAILDWNQDDAYTAMVLAHESGHLLGMWHDFQLDPRGRTCTEQHNGIMDYVRHFTRWTSCSVQDFQQYYNFVTKNTGGRFCLGGSSSSSCTDIYKSWCEDWCRIDSRVRYHCKKTCGLC